MNLKILIKLTLGLFLACSEAGRDDDWYEEELVYVDGCSYSYLTSEKISLTCDLKNLTIKRVNDLNIPIDYDYVFVQVSNKMLRNLTQAIFENYRIEQLELTNDQIQFVSSRTFAAIANLRILTLYNNELMNINDIQFSSDVSALSLIVTFNALTKLERSSTDRRLAVDYLDLSCNQIRLIENGTFHPYADLEILNLASNEIETLHAEMFSGLVNLTQLNLESNKLRILSAGTFLHLKNLKSLDVNSNLLEMFDVQSNSLEWLEMQSNQFSDLSALQLGHLNQLRKLNLKSNLLRTFEFERILNLTYLETIDLSSNRIESVQFNSNGNMRFEFMNELDLSYQCLIALPLDLYLVLMKNLTQLTLDYNRITAIERNQLLEPNAGGFKLEKLSLRNNLISDLNRRIFDGLGSLRALDFGHNLIRSLNDAVFDQLGQLKTLILKGNFIDVITSRSFTNLNQLDTLNLDNNQIRLIEPGAFVHLTSLQKLQLSNNKLDTVQANHFQNLPSLTRLTLANNLIIHIEPNSFSSLPKIIEINLNGNYLTSLDSRVVYNSNITLLTFTGNGMVFVQPDAFLRSDITELDLTGNKFKSIVPSLIAYVEYLTLNSNEFVQFVLDNVTLQSSLVGLYLNHNRIRKFVCRSDKFNRLRSLDLAYNLLENLTRLDFAPLTGLQYLDLSHNPLRSIDCDLFSPFGDLISLKASASLSNLVSKFDVNQLPNTLITLDLSLNNLGQIKLNKSFDSLVELNLSSVQLTDIGFDLTNKFQWIDLSYNRLNLSYLSVLSGVVSLVKVYLSGIELQSLDAFFDKNFNHLNLLDLSNNKLKSITTDSMRFLKYVASLAFGHNQIEFVEENAFAQLIYLDNLNLEYNRLKIFSFDFISNIFDSINLRGNNLTVYFRRSDSVRLLTLNALDLSSNQLNRLDFDNFFDRDTNNLTQLTIGYNQLESIDNDVFAEMLQLERLDLAHNRIERMGDECLWNLQSLVSLDLAANRLTLVGNENLFKFQYELTYLNMSYNRIETFPNGLFGNLFNLKQLDVRANLLKTIQDGVFENLKQLVYLDVSLNEQLRLRKASFDGLESVKDIWVSFGQLTYDEQNRIYMVNSLKLNSVRKVNDVEYFKSIYINYEDERVDCLMTLKYARSRLQLKLKSENDLALFLKNCAFTDLSLNN